MSILPGALRGDDRPRLVPEFIQPSAMDCGPAALYALLRAYEIPVSYGRLREACQTDVDGTSVDVLTDVARQLGLDAVQLIVPLDHLLRPETGALPAIVLARQPSGLLHFVVAWRAGERVQIMDPGSGRAWRSRAAFERDVFVHHLPVDPDFAEVWLGAEGFLDPLLARLAELGLADRTAAGLIDAEGWFALAAVDAAARLATEMVSAGALSTGVEAQALVLRMVERLRGLGPGAALERLPARYWSAMPGEDGAVMLRGAVLVMVAGPIEDAPEAAEDPARELAMARDQPPPTPLRRLAALVRRRRAALLAALLPALILAGAAAAIESLVLYGLLGGGLRPIHAVGFVAVLALLEGSATGGLLQLGRWLDARLRVRLLTHLPRLGNYYFHSRQTGDLAQRAHDLEGLPELPVILGEMGRVIAEAGVTTVGVAWVLASVDPALAVPALLGGGLVIGLPLIALPIVREHELRVRVHLGAILQSHLDGLLGGLAARAHGAGGALRSAHEALLSKWAEARLRLARVSIAVGALGNVAGVLLAVWLLGRWLASSDAGAATVLLMFWLLKLPALSLRLAGLAGRLPGLHNRLLRLFEVLESPEETALWYPDAPAEPPLAADGGVELTLSGVTVVAGGQRILGPVDLRIAPGEHVAVVGASGSGKSSLVGLLLGWHRPLDGEVRVDGGLLHGPRLEALRRCTAWVDPAVQLWSGSLEANLTYGNPPPTPAAVRAAVERAALGPVVDRLGLDGPVGEGGGLLSGGQGQRVRLARAFLRPGVRLAVLDEALRGLDRDLRGPLLARARRHWQAATMLCVLHDIEAAATFDRVLVVERGRIVEDGHPEALRASGGAFAALLDAERHAGDAVWGRPDWRRWRVEGGRVLGPEGAP